MTSTSYTAERPDRNHRLRTIAADANAAAVLLLDGVAHDIPRELALRMLAVAELVERCEA